MSDRVNVLREIEDMHERGYARECERGDLDKAAWHKECAEAIRALTASSEPPRGSPTDPLRSEAATRKDAEAAAPKPDVPVVAYAKTNLCANLDRHGRDKVFRDQAPSFGIYTPLVRQSDHLAAVEKLMLERDDARRMSSAHREHAQIAVDHSASVNRLLSIAEARAEALEAKFAKAKSVLRAARTTLNSVVALDDEDAVDGSDLSASCQEVVRRIDAALAQEQRNG